MKVVITDYPDVLGRDLPYETGILQNGLPGAEIRVYPYDGEKRAELYETISDADAILTAFLPLDKEALDRAPRLKCVAFNATGYDFIDYEEACRRNIAIIPIGEYCTWEVADHTLALILALSRGLKHYIGEIDVRRRWQYYSITGLRRLDGCTLGIFGFGKIGRAVAARAKGFGLNILACDPRLTSEEAQTLGVAPATAEEIWERADIVSNHMNQTERNRRLFCMETFRKMRKKPIFINCGRGGSVAQEDLVRALDEGLVSGAGLDVLEEEAPDLARCGLTNRENVIITPHAAFYSETSLRELQRISCENLVYYLNGDYDKVFKIVNLAEIDLPGKEAGG